MTEPEPLTNEEILARLDVVHRKIKELQRDIEELFRDGADSSG